MARFIITAEFDSLEEMGKWLNFQIGHEDLSPRTTQTLEVKPVVEPSLEEITEQKLRTFISQRIEEGHREAIVKKVRELGAENVSSLAQQNYKAMWDFLVGLKLT